MSRARGTVLLVLALLAALLTPAGAGEPPPLTSWPYDAGYVTMPDGTDLRYTVFLPDSGPGPWPVLLQYDGYAAGTNPYENGQDLFGPRMRAKGYAILGVNVRGSGCSEGTFDVFSHQWALDGYEVVEWAARQPWSNGSVGMFGVSMPAIMSLYVAALDPPHLAAIAPAAALTDLYRDVAYPGGIYNATFPTAWTALQKGTSYQDNPLVVAEDGDARCVANTAGHTAPDKVVAAQAAQHPYDDAFWARSLGDRIADVDAAVLSQTAWQDEQVSGRISSALRALDPATSFHVLTNGNHGVSVVAPAFADLQEDFFDRYVGGVANGFETTTPHVQVWHELQTPSYVPRWVTGHATWPTPAATTYHLTADGRLTPAAPLAAGRVPYLYPAPASSAASGGSDTETMAYKAPGFGVSFTTDPFASDVEVLGSASADLWVSSTATDTDLQVTLSEVRPDGQETFVQRGWLRASHRALDASRSTALLPYHPHTAATQVPLTPGVPALLRAEVFPSGHVFRAGSRLRLTVEAPLSVTGLRAFEVVPYPAVDTVHTGGTTPSRLVVGTVPATGVVAAYPPCDTLVNQPCRG
ncbi:MAG TPA: CocE/NonD family hydrolase [Frankiaceae bacterium]|nr:CocE/NonD family hydrolase [Frankiaceae bacterium]